ncbi:hypothetical protein ACIBCP_23435 [Streptomyces sp. NPDC051287]|uniref:hypothetical protein n=1 Tax=Streptomyces sp. NPDC051287 TaxID=3365648 RepID=UPI0037900FB7
MTKDKRRKAEIRAAQQDTGRRYTQLAREMAAGSTRAARTFLLSQLLNECATLPPADVDWGYDDEYAPAVFQSQVLGEAIPYGTVLELAGSLAREGHKARITVESMDPLETAFVVCNERRFRLIITQERADELCRTPGCQHSPTSWAFSRCDSHLADCDAQTLARMASDWGHARNEELDRDPTRLGGSPEADLLIRAAAANGAFEQVSKALLHMCFEDPDVIDEVFWNEADALAMRYGLERERLRLYEVARNEATRIRAKVGSCTTCNGLFSKPSLRAWDTGMPPQFCSKDCLPPSTPAPGNHLWN